MSATRRIVVVQAGLGQPSSTRLLADRLATATGDALLERGHEAEVDVVDLREHAHDLANTLLTGFATGGLRDAVDAVAAADACHRGDAGVPGVLQRTVQDVLRRPRRRTRCAARPC